MPTRTAEAVWEGDLKSGKGNMKLSSGSFNGAYSFATRFENTPGTNPEELIAAAHAGCFSMAFSNELAKAGFVPTSVHTAASVTIEAGAISKIDLKCDAVVPNIDEKKFQEIGAQAKAGCPVSKALAAVPSINLTATLKH